MAKDHSPNGIGHNSNALQDKSPTVEALEALYIVQSAVRFIDKLNHYISRVRYHVKKGIEGKNSVERSINVRDADLAIRKLTNMTTDWQVVIDNMKQGKDVHIQENCKSEKLNIVAGEHYDFGQYLINVNSPKWCKENTDGKKFMQEVAELKRSHD